MKTKFRLLSFLLIAALLSGCGNTTKKGEDSVPVEDPVLDEAEMFTDNDYNTKYDDATSVSVVFNENSVSCDSKAVAISGTTISIQEEGTYILSGTSDGGTIIVNTDKNAKPHLIFNGVSAASLSIEEAEKVFVTLEKNTENSFDSIFSKQDLTFNGSGKLEINSTEGNGIECNDDLVFTGGNYVIKSASHGLEANDSIRITEASFEITSGKDGFHAENSDDENLGFIFIKDGSTKISAEGDGLSASSVMQIKDGTFDIVTGGGSENASKQTSDNWGGFPGGGMGGKRPGRGDMHMQMEPQQESSTASDDTSTSIKGLKSSGQLTIYNGSFTIDSADDSIHSNASITIGDGSFQIASGDDAFHADDTLTILGGTIDITKCYEGLEGLHVVVHGGNTKLVASDDGLNAAGGTDESGMGGFRGNDQFGPRPGGMSGSSSNGSIVIAGGTLYVQASGDGLDANGTLEISGGHTTVAGPTRGDTAVLDYDKSGTITGGTFIGTGASNMAQTLSSTSQGVIAVRLGQQSAKTAIVLKDTNGNEVLTSEPELDFQLVILSSPKIKKGETYTLNIGTATQQLQAN